MSVNINDLKWHVVYTRPKAEKKVASCISNLGIESYLPLHRVMRQWSDRKKKVEVPLFPNYVFVKISDRKRPFLFSIKELVSYVSIERKPVVVRDNEILIIKKVLTEEEDLSVEEYFQEGLKVRVKSGPFVGLEGVIIKKGGNTRLIIKVDGLMKAFSFNISTTQAELVNN